MASGLGQGRLVPVKPQMGASTGDEPSPPLFLNPPCNLIT
jgi:hypothetical protein